MIDDDFPGWLYFGDKTWIRQSDLVEVNVETDGGRYRVRAINTASRYYIKAFDTEPEAEYFARLCLGASGPQQYPAGEDIDHDILGMLSKFHVDVLCQIAKGESPDHTCFSLQISHRTYTEVRKMLLRRINVMDNDGLTVFARKNHLI